MWRPRPAAPAAAVLMSVLLTAVPAGGQPAPARVPPEPPEDPGTTEYVRSHYSKFEYRIPMRDGARLFTAVYVPNDRSRKYPFLMLRTPYNVGPYGTDRYKDKLGPSAEFAREGFIFVYQDVRGRFMSEGEFVNMRPHVDKKTGPQDVDESTDTYDTIEWLLENVPGHNGRAGQWGISYPGFFSSAGMIDSHPALKAVSPQAPIADWWRDDFHRHGAFILPMAFNFFSRFGVKREELTTIPPERFDHKTPDGYQFFLDLGPLTNVNKHHFKGEINFWNKLVEHPNFDEFWQARNILPHLKNITAAVMTVGGWYDTEDLYGPLKTYRSVEIQNPGIHNTLVMGPWRHGGWNRDTGETLGEEDFGFNTAEFYQQNVQLPFFNKFLKEKGELDLPEALVFETGANRWRRYDAWPPSEVEKRKLFLQADQGLSFEPPAGTSSSQEAYDDYPSDPRKPVPYTMEVTAAWAKEYMTEDQRFAAWRPDVLVYKTDSLDHDLTLVGPLFADLWVSTTGSDSDWIVKLIDVHPGEVPDWDEEKEGVYPGEVQRLVRAEALRGRFRNNPEAPEPFEPGKITRLEFELQDVFHTFKRGHRVMVQIQSTWFPFVDRNPQKYVPNIFEATEADFIRVTNSVYRSSEHPSGVRVGVMPQADQP